MNTFKRIKLRHGTMLVDKIDWETWKHVRWMTMIHHTGKYYVKCSSRDRKKHNLPTNSLHRLILNPPEGFVVDHIRDTLDNRRSKLRVCTSSQNSLNRATYKNPEKTSIYKGVSLDKETGKWAAVFRGKRLGRFMTPEDAALAYNKAALAHDAEFAKVNKIK